MSTTDIYKHLNDQGTFTSVGAQGGFHATPLNHFPTGILP